MKIHIIGNALFSKEKYNNHNNYSLSLATLMGAYKATFMPQVSLDALSLTCLSMATFQSQYFALPRHSEAGLVGFCVVRHAEPCIERSI